MNNQSRPPSPKLFVVLGVCMFMASAGAVLFVGLAASPEPVAAEPPVVQQAKPAHSEPVGPRNRGPVEPEPAPAESEQPPAPANDKAKRMARDLEREQIWRALGQAHGLEPAAPGSAAPSESAAALLPTLDLDYVRETIEDQLVPVAEDCYQSARSKDPELRGKLNVDFTIVGSQDIGGIVEEAEIGEGSTLDSAFMRECLRESMFVVSFVPPPDGGRIEISYTMNFEAPEQHD